MQLINAAKLFFSFVLWKWFGFKVAGNGLIEALGSRDENTRTLAGIFLVRSGRRSRPLLEKALQSREHLLMVIPILGDIGDPSSMSMLAEFTQDADPKVARAAGDAIELIQFSRQGVN